MQGAAQAFGLDVAQLTMLNEGSDCVLYEFERPSGACLLAGYAQQNQLSQEWLDRLPLFVDYRRLLMYSVRAGELPRLRGGRETY